MNVLVEYYIVDETHERRGLFMTDSLVGINLYGEQSMVTVLLINSKEQTLFFKNAEEAVSCFHALKQASYDIDCHYIMKGEGDYKFGWALGKALR